MPRIHLTAPTLAHEGADATASCVVSIPGREPQSLSITGSRVGVVDRADAFVAFSLLPAMKLGVQLVSDAPVSRSLLEVGLPAIQRIYRLWRTDGWRAAYPEFRPVPVVAEAIDDREPGQAVGCFYSGGVDSSFSLLEAGDEITDLLFIRDFDAVFPDDQDSQAIAGVTNVADRRGKRVIVAHSNAKELFSDLVSWQHYHGGFLAGIALHFQDQLQKVHIPSSYSIQHLPIWGSHPCLDPLWSTRALTLVHDRIDVSRVEKTAAIADDPLLLANLRVCWKPVHNCGTCPKCLRTLLTLQVLGRYERGNPFHRAPITAHELARMDLRRGYEFFSEIEQYLTDAGTDPDMLTALKTAHSGWFHTRLGSLFRGDLTQRARSSTRRTAWRTLSATGTLDTARRARQRIRGLRPEGRDDSVRRGASPDGADAR